MATRRELSLQQKNLIPNDREMTDAEISQYIPPEGIDFSKRLYADVMQSLNQPYGEEGNTQPLHIWMSDFWHDTREGLLQIADGLPMNLRLPDQLVSMSDRVQVENNQFVLPISVKRVVQTAILQPELQDKRDAGMAHLSLLHPVLVAKRKSGDKEGGSGFIPLEDRVQAFLPQVRQLTQDLVQRRTGSLVDTALAFISKKNPNLSPQQERIQNIRMALTIPAYEQVFSLAFAAVERMPIAIDSIHKSHGLIKQILRERANQYRLAPQVMSEIILAHEKLPDLAAQYAKTLREQTENISAYTINPGENIAQLKAAYATHDQRSKLGHELAQMTAVSLAGPSEIILAQQALKLSDTHLLDAFVKLGLRRVQLATLVQIYSEAVNAGDSEETFLSMYTARAMAARQGQAALLTVKRFDERLELYRNYVMTSSFEGRWKGMLSTSENM